MIPSYPTLTFPNHYSIATGLYPSHHGLVDNYFYSPQRKQFYSMSRKNAVFDGEWYGGTPLWVLAEQQQMITASYYWVGTEAAIQGLHPTYYYNYYNDSIPIDRRIQVVIDWLQLPPQTRPHFISFYFPRVDTDGHDFGPDASETGKAVRWVDSSIAKLTIAVQKTGLPVNFIFVADHGMTTIDNVNMLSLPSAIDTSRFVIPRGVELVHLYARDKKDIRPTYRALKKQELNFKAYLLKDVPRHLHYNKKDDWMGRIGDIILIPTWPKVFNLSGGRKDPGAHGYDPALVKDMNTIFYAWGPHFKSGIQIPAFENVHVYAVVTRILGLTYTHRIDGTNSVADAILR